MWRFRTYLTSYSCCKLSKEVWSMLNLNRQLNMRMSTKTTSKELLTGGRLQALNMSGLNFSAKLDKKLLYNVRTWTPSSGKMKFIINKLLYMSWSGLCFFCSYKITMNTRVFTSFINWITRKSKRLGCQFKGRCSFRTHMPFWTHGRVHDLSHHSPVHTAVVSF